MTRPMAALRAVLEMHCYDELVLETEGRAVCSECWGRDADVLVAWPCPTVATITQALEGDTND